MFLSDDNMDAKLIVIDYVFCSYNYRAFDIANHFQEWMYDYTNKSYPYYYIAKDKFPSKAETSVVCPRNIHSYSYRVIRIKPDVVRFFDLVARRVFSCSLSPQSRIIKSLRPHSHSVAVRYFIRKVCADNL